MVEGALKAGHNLVETALPVGHDPEAAFKARGKACMAQLDEVTVVVGVAKHVVHELPEAVPADIFVEEARRPGCGEPILLARARAWKVLSDIVDRCATAYLGALTRLLS